MSRLRDDAHAFPFQRFEARDTYAFDLDRDAIQTSTKSLDGLRVEQVALDEALRQVGAGRVR